MKTTKFLFILLLPLLFGQGVKGQGYRPFPKENAFWTTWGGSHPQGYWDYSLSNLFTIHGDTLYQGKTYYKAYIFYKHSITGDTLIELHSLIREDTIQRKVWFVRLYFNEFEEKLGYDFSANAGDTLVLPALDFYELDPNNSLVLRGDSVFTLAYKQNILLANGEYSVGHVYYPINSFGISFDIIEGIGCGAFPFPNPMFGPFSSSYFEVLTCLIIEDIFVYGDEYGCGFYPVSIQDNTFSKIYVYPNPCSDQLNLRFENPTHESISIELISHTGKVVYSDNISNVESYSLYISNFACGLYLLRLSVRQQMQTFKIIVTH